MVVSFCFFWNLTRIAYIHLDASCPLSLSNSYMPTLRNVFGSRGKIQNFLILRPKLPPITGGLQGYKNIPVYHGEEHLGKGQFENFIILRNRTHNGKQLMKDCWCHSKSTISEPHITLSWQIEKGL